MAINKVVYGNNTLMDITDTTATSEDVANGKIFYGANGVKSTGTAGSGSSWKLLATKEITTQTTSTSASQLTTVECGTEASTKDKIIYVRIRDKSPRKGHFLGSDNFIINTNDANGSTSAQSTTAKFIHRYASGGTFGVYTPSGSAGYGVYVYSLQNKAPNKGTIVIYQRYNSTNSLTVDGTYSIEVYALDYPDGKSVFNI